jgi:hypothetical protein
MAFGIDPSKRTTLPIALRATGIVATSEADKSIYDKYFNQLIFESQADHIWGTSDQVKNSPIKATFYTDASGNPLDASDAAITFNHDDRIVMVHDTALTANLVIDGGAKRLNITTDRGITIDLGADAGNSNVPYRIQLKNADQSTCHFRTNKDYTEVLSAKAAATREEKSVISNQTANSVIYLNNRQIFGRNLPVQLTYKEKDPYFIQLNGETGLSQIEYKDFFSRIGYSATTSGQYDGAVTNSEFTAPNTTGKFTRIGDAGGTNDLEAVHSRTSNGANFQQWPNTATNISAAFTSGSNEITLDATAAGTEADNLAFLQSLKGLRVVATTAGLVPDTSTSPNAKTSIISDDINISTPSAVVLKLIDSVTGADANSTATDAADDITISNSGNVQGSEESDTSQGFQVGMNESDNGVSGPYFGVASVDGQINQEATLSSYVRSVYQNSTKQGDAAMITALDDGTNGAYRSGAENTVNSTLKFEFWAA